MPPKQAQKGAGSDGELKTGTTSRAANKARNAVAVAAQQELLAKHIHSNGPQDQPKVEPLDFFSLDQETLTRYNLKNGLNLPRVQSINDNILQSEIGKKTSTFKKSQGISKITKPELANHCQKHFMSAPCKENEMIATFLYKVKNEDREFKLSF